MEIVHVSDLIANHHRPQSRYPWKEWLAKLKSPGDVLKLERDDFPPYSAVYLQWHMPNKRTNRLSASYRRHGLRATTDENYLYLWREEDGVAAALEALTICVCLHIQAEHNEEGECTMDNCLCNDFDEEGGDGY